MFLADFHMHSNFSDGKLSIRELVDLHGRLGFGAIAITDHLCDEKSWTGKAARILNRSLTRESFPRYQETIREEAERAWKQYRMVVLPGVEFTRNSPFNHRSAHILGLGLKEYILPDTDSVVLCRQIRAQGALSIAAHPVNTGLPEKQTYHLWDRREELAPEFDAWEVASGPKIFQEVLRSGLPLIANSDLHHPKQIASWKTVLTCERHPEAILEAIRAQELSFVFHSGTNVSFTPRALFPKKLDKPLISLAV